MTITLFITILTAGSVVSSLLTEAIKKWYANAGKEYSANVIALIDAVVIGGGVTSAVYMLMEIPWTVNNIICLAGMVVTTWICSMIGYDKVMQLAKQLKEVIDDEKEEEADNSVGD